MAIYIKLPSHYHNELRGCESGDEIKIEGTTAIYLHRCSFTGDYFIKYPEGDETTLPKTYEFERVEILDMSDYEKRVSR